MNFATSTHKRDWLFDVDTLRQKHVDVQQQALQTLLSGNDEYSSGDVPDAKKQKAACPITVEDETQLKLYYQVRLKAICQSLQLPSKVLNAALIFFKRFYTQASCLEHDPTRVMPTCIYLACKVEEAYRSAESLCKSMAIDVSPVLRFEVLLLQGLKFDLVVHSPYRALAGLFKEFDNLRSQRSSQLDAGLLSASSETLAAAHTKARSSVDILVMTDAPLLFTPGVIAVAAMRSGFRGVQISCQKLLQHIARRAAASAAAESDAVEDAEQQLLDNLAAVDALAAQQGQLDEAALQQKASEVDRTIKLWRKSLQASRADSKGSAGAAVAGE